MVTVSEHFDGKVVIPDESLDLPPNEALIVQIGGREAALAEESALTWLAANAVDSEAIPGDLAERHDRYLYGRSFWVAISSKRDQYHSQAVAWQEALVRTASRIVTTEAVLWEWLNALSDTTMRVIAAEGYRRVYTDR